MSAMLGALQLRAGRPAGKALAGLSRAASTIAAEFAASKASVESMLAEELAAAAEEAAAGQAASEAAQVLAGSHASDSTDAAVEATIVPEELKPHHAGYYEAQAAQGGAPHGSKVSYDGWKVRQHYGQDPAMFTADPPVPGGAMDLESAAAAVGVDTSDMLAGVFTLEEATRAHPRLVADFERYLRGDPLVNKEQERTFKKLVDAELSKGDFWASLLQGEGVVEDFAGALQEAADGSGPEDTTLNIDLSSLPADVEASQQTPEQTAALRGLLLPLLTEASKVDDTTQRLLGQTAFPAVSGEWRLPKSALTAAHDASDASTVAASSPGAEAAAAPHGQGEEDGEEDADLAGARSLAAAVEEVDGESWPRDPNFRPPITDPNDSDYMSDPEDQEDNWPLFRDHKTEHLQKGMQGASGSSGVAGELDDVLVAADYVPGGAELQAQQEAAAPLPGSLAHSRAYKPHHFRMLQAYRAKDLLTVFSLWDHVRGQSTVPDYIATHIALDAAASAGSAEVFAVVLEDVLTRRGEFTAETFKLALKAAGVLGNVEAAEAAFSAMASNADLAGAVDIHCYTPLMAAAVAEGDIQRAFHWFNRMRHAQLRPSDTVFRVLITGAAASRSAAPLHLLWSAMRLHSVVAISQDTWHALLDGFLAAPSVDADTVWDVYTSMAHPKWFGGPVVPDAARLCDVFNAVVEAGMYDEARRVESHMATAGMFDSKAINASDIRDIVASFPPPGTQRRTASKWDKDSALYGAPYLPEDFAETEARLEKAAAQVEEVGSMARLGGADVKDYPWEREADAER